MTSQTIRSAQAIASLAAAYACVRLVLYGIGWLVLWFLDELPRDEVVTKAVGIAALGYACAIAIPPYIAWRVYTR